MTNTCPECGYSAKTAADSAPTGGKTVGCPKCRKRFRVMNDETSADELQIICPSCGHEQAVSPECNKCGLIFARYRAATEKPAVNASAASETWLIELLKRWNRDLRLPLAVLALILVWLLIKNLIPTSVVRSHETLSASAGMNHAVIVRKDGTVWTWGSNSDGQLGYGERGGLAKAPVKVPGIDGVTSVAAGALHTLALKKDGTVWGWGSNAHGQLGDVSGAVNRIQPAQLPGLTGITAIAAGDYFSLALKGDGTLWHIGDSVMGHLSNGGINTLIAMPVQLTGITEVATIAAGRRSAVALKKDGTVWAWGDNAQGQLGDGSYEIRWEPVQVKGLQDVTAIGSGEQFGIALKKDGTVWGWGTLFIAGAENLQRASEAKQLKQLSGATDIKAGYWHALALRKDGTVWYSGSSEKVMADEESKGFWGLLKRSSTAGVGAIYTGGRESFLEKRDGTLVRLGYGEIGEERKPAGRKPPEVTVLAFTAADAATTVASPSAVSAAPVAPDFVLQSITAGNEHSLALTRDGIAWAWGSNEDGQLGPRQSSANGSPQKMYANSREPFGLVRSIAGGEHFTVAVRNDGSIWLWGRRIPKFGVSAKESCIRMPKLEQVVSVSAGPSYFLALMQDGTVSAWGRTIGVDALQEPVTIAGLADISAISAGANHAVAIRRDGSIWSWGKNDQGQLGDGSREPRAAPVRVKWINNVVKVSAGSDFTLALKGDGTVWGWGANLYAVTDGGLKVKDSSTPVRIPGFEHILDIAVPGYSFSNGGHVLALDESGAVWSRGFNNHGQLGQGTVAFNFEQAPARVIDLQDVIAIAAGSAHSLALKKDGSLWAWGKNFRGQLGTAKNIDSAFPQRVVFTDDSAQKKP